MFEVTEAWKSAFPDAHAGVLVMRAVRNPASHADLERCKEALMEELRSRYGGLDRSQLQALPALQVYDAYYKRFKKTYHVQLQLESILFKGKSIPSVAALVEAMFMAEIKNMLLTAGHDLDTLQLPIRLDVTRGDEVYTLLRGQPQQVKPGDMIISDGQGIISNIIYGPDQRTQIQPGTRNVIYTTYAPAGIAQSSITRHLQDIEEYVRMFSPQAQNGTAAGFRVGRSAPTHCLMLAVFDVALNGCQNLEFVGLLAGIELLQQLFQRQICQGGEQQAGPLKRVVRRDGVGNRHHPHPGAVGSQHAVLGILENQQLVRPELEQVAGLQEQVRGRFDMLDILPANDHIKIVEQTQLVEIALPGGHVPNWKPSPGAGRAGGRFLYNHSRRAGPEAYSAPARR